MEARVVQKSLCDRGRGEDVEVLMSSGMRESGMTRRCGAGTTVYSA